MSTLKDKLSETMKASLRAQEKNMLAFARNLHAAIRKKEIDDKVMLDDQGVQKIAQSLIKQRQDSIEQFKAGNRADLVEKEEAELKFLQGFIPAQLGEVEVKAMIDQAISESGAISAKDMGKVMKILMPKIQGRADGKWVNQYIKEKLGGTA
ncbi:MAG: GatB/YqeY domain-containing protein [Bdellovibrio sp.]|nr:GatB/YqeY domain-containing protein [Bdellovibrio sp.]